MSGYRRLLRLVAWCALLAALAMALVLHRAWLPAAYDPTRPLDLRAERTFMTPVKLRVLDAVPSLCRAALGAGGRCVVPDAVRVEGGAAPAMPDGFPASCRLAVRWAMFQTDVAEPAARAVFGQGVRAIRQAGTYACRDIRDRPGAASSHAGADAIDVSGFILADGREVSVGAWKDTGGKAAFLHRVRAGACRLFGIVLSPDYNAWHAGHLHLQATGGGLCD
ncbi:Extensin family protein [Gluconacetobacter diazotrophicus PA1 5]|uniref:extensin-like domain-containing protein n=1 Tax=Gluconacetobacter diazotrophicus TaxID=33996 RepID=UPI000173D9AC|nr:extensin family protein [Gluconacetobacter diazotrophicus]ACI52373.1 Extensin family protein [Gluconacetobacter diazotrophicus PA1 5]TWB05530.1 extensin-like protein [Gluconacetobacter diazotrophicus]